MARSRSQRSSTSRASIAGGDTPGWWERTDIRFLFIVVIAAMVWIVYGGAIHTPFIFDDIFSITGNQSIRTLWPHVGDSEHSAPLKPPNDMPMSGRPLVNLSLAVNYHFGQLEPEGYHEFNLVVHLLSALLLMGIVRRTLRLEYFSGRFTRVSGLLAFAVAVLWAVHPLQTETVIYITQRTELLVGFFYLATIFASLCYWSADTRAGRTMWLVLSTVSCLAGMACKEVMVSAPLVVLLFDRTFISGSFRRALRQSWPLYVGLAFGWGMLLWLNFTAPRSLSAGFHLGVSAHAWWFTQAMILLMYLKLCIWPWPLLIHYEMPYLSTLSAAWPWLAIVFVLVVATLVLLARRNSIGFVGAWILLILSPTLIVPIVFEMAAERRMYLPLAALVTLFVVGGYVLIQQLLRRTASSGDRRQFSDWSLPITSAIVAIVVATLSAVSMHRLEAYYDELGLWQDAAKHQPQNSLAYNNISAIQLKSGRPRGAIEAGERALSINPTYPEAQVNLANALVSVGRIDEAIADYQKALQRKPQLAEIHNNLGLALLQVGRTPEAIEQLQQALALARVHGKTEMAQQIEAWLNAHAAGEKHD